MQKRYIGVETEHAPWVRRNWNSDYISMRRFTTSQDSIIGDRAYTHTGNQIYWDLGGYVEVVTPPISLNQGFASRLRDLVLLGNRQVMNKGVTLTGNRMHWNVSYDDDNKATQYFRKLRIPFLMLASTPITYDCSYRLKPSNFPKRLEMRSSYINNPEQISAAALFLGAFALADDMSAALEFSRLHPSCRAKGELSHNLPAGRDTLLEAVRADRTVLMSAQEYMEMIYDLIIPFINALGKSEEVANLKAFISGENQLEIDKMQQYAELVRRGCLDRFDNIRPYSRKSLQSIIRVVEGEPEIPLEGKLMAMLYPNATDMNWDFVETIDNDVIFGIDDIYAYAASLGGLPNVEHLDLAHMIT